ncbi:MAG: FG-GAP-like repeat-containing protein [Chloroflexota bacterium]
MYHHSSVRLFIQIVLSPLFALLLLSQPVLADLGETYLQVGTAIAESQSVAWGDMDADGDLDLAVGNKNAPVRIYENVNGILQLAPTNLLGWQSAEESQTTSLDWGDWDGDGDLDLAIGNNNDFNVIYENSGDTFFLAQILSANDDPDGDRTQSVAWGDWDGDGDLDLAVGNRSVGGDPDLNAVYENDGGLLQLDPDNGFGWLAPTTQGTTSVAWGDWDNDGDLDLAVANDSSEDKVYEYDGTDLKLDVVNGFGWQSPEATSSFDVAWGDWDGDGDLDLAVASNVTDSSRVFVNDGGTLNFDPDNGVGWESSPLNADDPFPSYILVVDVEWGDWDGDGDLDLATAGLLGEGSWIYENDDGTLKSDPGGGFGWRSEQKFSFNDVAWGDIDNDGDLDLATASFATTNLVYINDGGGLRYEPSEGFGWLGDTPASSVAWGDWDDDGDLDLAASRRVYENVNGTLTFSATEGWESPDSYEMRQVAWGDWDGDGDLDLAAVNSGSDPLVVYENHEGTLQLDTGSGMGWQSAAPPKPSSLSWGDWDNDGDLDLAIGSGDGADRVYENEGGTLALDTANGLGWEAPETVQTKQVAWGDWDNDGDLDLAVAHTAGILLYEYHDNTLQLDLENALGWQQIDTIDVSDIAWADYDADGDLDLAAAQARIDSPQGSTRIFENENGTLTLDPGNGLGWQAAILEMAFSLSWGDWDGDGDLDLLRGLNVHENESGEMGIAHRNNNFNNNGSAWGDWDNDGDLDVALVGANGNPRVVENTIQDEINFPTKLPNISIVHPGTTPAAGYGSAALRINDAILPVAYTVTSSTAKPLGQLQVSYSLNGGGEWFPAVGATLPPTTTLPGSYVFNWDTLASGFFGESDNVVLRFELPIQAPSTNSGTYQYTDQAPGPVQCAYISARTLPLRVQGTQVRVLNGTEPVTDAIVYRLPSGAAAGGQLLGDTATGLAFSTNPNGYLTGRGQIGLGDELLALAPIELSEEETERYGDALSLYHTNGTPTETGLTAHTVTAAGVQTLQVSANNPLMLFDLDITLEWDVSNDATYLEQLDFDIRQASEFLYDFTDGQVALGDVWVYQNADRWSFSHINVHATNRLRPYATIGGVVITETVHIIPELSDIGYDIGQVHMGSTWNRYGNPGQSLGVDWPVILAHELGHYLLYLEDTYLGLESFDGAEVLTTVNTCLGSAMGDVYDINNTEFIFDDLTWLNTCNSTLAQQELERDEWEIMRSWYPWLQVPSAINQGPSLMPYELTTISVFNPLTPTNVLVDPTFSLDYANSEVGTSEARAFLLRNTDNEIGTPVTTDDYEYMYDLGSPTGGQNRMLARGAQPGDRLCVFDQARNQYGCEIITLGDERLTLEQDSTWTPVIRISPINSTTFTVEVDGLAAGLSLKARLYPEFGKAFPITDGFSYNNGLYSTNIALDYAALNGNLQLWVDEGPDSEPYANPRRETVVTYRIGGNPGSERGGGGSERGGGGSERGGGGSERGGGGSERGGGGSERGGGGSERGGGGNVLGEGGAPAVSPDGQMVYFDRNFDLAVGEFYTIQDMAGLPSLPDDKVAIGRGYNLFATGFSVTNPLTGSVSFQYQGTDVLVEERSEEELGIHFWDGTQWLALNTRVDTTFNLASARSQGPGIYALLAGITRPEITAVAPASATNDGETTLIIQGGYFLSPVEITLAGPTSTFTLSLQSLDSTTITATVPTGLPAREYRVQVGNANQPGGSAASLTPGTFALYDPAQACFYDFFESGLGHWQAEGDWNIVIMPDGNRAMTDSPSGPYKNAEDYGVGVSNFTTYLTSNPFSLDSCPSPVLSFNHDYALATVGIEQDFGRVEISADAGVSWTGLLTITDGVNDVNSASLYDQPSTEWANGHWRNVQIDLSEYADTVQLRFSLEVNDDSISSKGWVIDDLLVTDIQNLSCQLYGAFDRDGDSQLFRIRPEISSIGLLGDVANNAGIRAMDVDPITGNFYAVQSRKNLDRVSELYRLNPVSGALTLIGDILTQTGQKFKGVESLTFDSSGGLWGFATTGSEQRMGLIQIDPSTGIAALVYQNNKRVRGMAWSPDDSTLWLTVNQKLFSYTATGNSLAEEYEFVALPGKIRGLDMKTDGRLVTAIQNLGMLTLYILDPTTGQVEIGDSFAVSGLGKAESLIWPEGCGESVIRGNLLLPSTSNLYVPLLIYD